MKKHNAIIVPTLAVCERLHSARFGQILTPTRRAWELGARLGKNASMRQDPALTGSGCGGDTGTYPHGENAREMELMIEAGVPVGDTLTAGTLRG